MFIGKELVKKATKVGKGKRLSDLQAEAKSVFFLHKLINLRNKRLIQRPRSLPLKIVESF